MADGHGEADGKPSADVPWQQAVLAMAQHPATKSARPSALEAKDAHQPHPGGTKSARAGKKRGPRMVSRRPVTTDGKVMQKAIKWDNMQCSVFLQERQALHACSESQ
eukprot:352598-Chlamydomonas_euryale.AAC.18